MNTAKAPDLTLPASGSPRFAVVIPVYNHAAKVAQVAEKAKALGFPVFVVDDGSTDGTAETLTKVHGITVLTHEKNRGKGFALLTGFRAAAAIADYAISIDADGQHDPADASTLIAAISLDKRSLIIGKRQDMEEVGSPWSSRKGREFSNSLVRFCGGPKVTDSQSGFRIYPLPEVLKWKIWARHYGFEIEVLVWARWAKMTILEAPISVYYGAPGERITHYRPGKEFSRNSFMITRLQLYRWWFRPAKVLIDWMIWPFKKLLSWVAPHD